MPIFNPTDADFLANPYPKYRELRKDNPIYYYDKWDKWIITRYKDINSLLRDKRLGRVIYHLQDERFISPPNPEHAAFDAIQHGSLLELEPPDHTRIRQVVHEVFTPKHVRQLSDKIAAISSKMVDNIIDKKEFNLITDFAEILPVTVISELLGVPEEDRSKLVPWSKDIIGMFEPEKSKEIEQKAVQAAQDFADYVRYLMAIKAKTPSDDLISRLVEINRTNPERITKSEIVANAILFLNAGHEAVVNVIGNGVYALLKHPAQFDKLKADINLLETAIEEILRYDSPLQFFERYVLEDMDFEGYNWKKGTKLCLFYASANHDSEVFDNSEVFDITRNPNPHISFGLGLHYCIGAPLARLELNSALKELISRMPDIKLAKEVEYHPKNVFRYLKELRLSH